MPLYQHAKPATHYEHCKGSRSINKVSPAINADMVKQQAFLAMDELEGWCSKEKAGKLIEIILAHRPKKIVEIGVFGGKSLVPMAFALRELQNNGKVYGIDPWSTDASVEGMDGINRDWWGKIDHQKILSGLQEKIIKFGLQDHIKLLQTTSDDANPILHIDILHIDGNHSDKQAYHDATKWVPFVKKGGLIIFDDVGGFGTDRAVAWIDKHCKKLAEYKDSNVWGVWIKK